MNIRHASHGFSQYLRTTLLALAVGGVLWATGHPAVAATVTVNPFKGATGVSRSAQVVYTFSEAMSTEEGVASFTFIKLGGIPEFPVTSVTWNPAGTVATNSLSPGTLWPDNASIQWFLYAETLDGTDAVEDSGSFSTSGSSSGGTGTNAVTSFSVGVYHSYLQTNNSAPVLDPDTAYFFRAGTVLASNRTATGVIVQPPGLSALALIRSPITPEIFSFFDYATNNLPAFNAKYPGGAYQFTVSAATSNQQINVTLSNPTNQPNAPHVTNYAAAQAVNAAQSFTLSWDPFVGGTTNDFILVEVGTDFRTPETPQQGGLNGTATSVVIPANTLHPNSTNTATIYFAHLAFASNGTASGTSSERVTTTEFSLKTTGASSAPTMLTNIAAILPGQFQFQVQATNGQPLFVESSVTLLSNSWTTVWTTNATGPLTTIVLPMTSPGRQFFRVRTD